MASFRSPSGGVTVGAAAAAKVGKGDAVPAKRAPPTAKTMPSAAAAPPTAATTAFSEFDPVSMAKVVALVGDRDVNVIEQVRQTLTRAGVKQVHGHSSLEPLVAFMAKVTPDLIIVGDDLDPGVFGFVRDIRHNKIGSNPFVLVTTLIAADHFDAVKQAMQAGTDDIIVKPVKEDQLLQRLKRVTVNRQAFVVTSDYLGPDRRARSRPSSIQRIDVLNTMLEKATGKDVSTEEVKAAVDGSMNQVFHARLDSHGYRLGFVCNLLIDAYDNNRIDQGVQENLKVLVDVLRDAAKTAERVNEKELGMLCGSLSKEVEGIAERYMAPSVKDLALIRKLTRAVLLALKPNIPPDQLEKETKAAAQNHLQRQREAFGKSAEIQRSPEDTAVDTVDEPIIEILPLNKGQTLFKQGEPATSAYILVNGAIGIYRDIDGQRLPVARIRKGEFFGEMAIIDGTPRRATAIALEASTVSIVAKEMIEEKMGKADVSTKFIINMLIASLRKVPEKYAAKSRQIADVVREMREQVDHVHGFATSPAAPAEAKMLLAGPAGKLTTAAKDIAKLIDAFSGSERRAAAMPPPTPPSAPPPTAQR